MVRPASPHLWILGPLFDCTIAVCRPVYHLIHKITGFVPFIFTAMEEFSQRLHYFSTEPEIPPTLQRASIPLDRAAAAIMIQKYVRGYLARKPFLPRNLYPKYRAQCDKMQRPTSPLIPQAGPGKTYVYLPQEMPEVVLKKSGHDKAIQRFHQMQEVRSILNAQNSSHLMIPKARLCQNFLVEERLPIHADSYHSMGFYLSQPRLFDEAVRELTRLFSRIHLGDLVGLQWQIPLGHIADIEDCVRYDNLPLYIVEEKGKTQGKIGLIDLESAWPRSDSESPNSKGLETLARIFPLHLSLIKEEATQLKMEVNESSLETAASTGKKYLQVGFTDHLNWLKHKGISTTSPQPFQISPQRAEQLTTVLEKELLKLNQGVNDLFVRRRYEGDPPKNFLTENPEKMARELAISISAVIINNLEAQIEKEKNQESNKLAGGDITESDLVSLRSPLLKRPKLYEHVNALLEKNKKIKFDEQAYYEREAVAEQLAHAVMEALVKGGDIFYFDPAYYTGMYDLCWIRY